MKPKISFVRWLLQLLVKKLTQGNIDERCFNVGIVYVTISLVGLMAFDCLNNHILVKSNIFLIPAISLIPFIMVTFVGVLYNKYLDDVEEG